MVLEKWWSQTPSDYFENMVNNFLHVVIHIISFNMDIEVINHNEPRQKKVNIRFLSHPNRDDD